MSLRRRDLLRFGLGLGVLRSFPLVPAPAFGVPAQRMEEEPRFTPPPGEETAAIAALIDRAKADLEAGRATTNDLLASPSWMPAHPWPRFRALIRRFARESRAVLVTPEEGGDRLRVTGTVRDSDGKPLAGALLYVYQTGAKGWYSDLSPHISGNGGDEQHARLFGYLRTGTDGRYELQTIRPAGYPHSDLPQHIHVEGFHPKGTRTFVTELRFDDDPRLTPAQRETSRREGFQIRRPTLVASRSWTVEADFQFR